jgi:hypothetical protein
MRVFISHSSEDSEQAAEVARALTECGYDVLVRDSASDALQRADAMVVLVSPESTRSPYVRGEIEFALSNPRFADRLVSVTLESTSDEPWILRRLQNFRAGNDLAKTGRRIAEALEKTS